MKVFFKIFLLILAVNGLLHADNDDFFDLDKTKWVQYDNLDCCYNKATITENTKDYKIIEYLSKYKSGNVYETYIVRINKATQERIPLYNAVWYDDKNNTQKFLTEYDKKGRPIKYTDWDESGLLYKVAQLDYNEFEFPVIICLKPNCNDHFVVVNIRFTKLIEYFDKSGSLIRREYQVFSSGESDGLKGWLGIQPERLYLTSLETVQVEYFKNGKVTEREYYYNNKKIDINSKP